MRIKLPKSKHKLGYTHEELDAICDKLKINREDLSNKLGIVTAAIDEETREILIYECDIRQGIECLLQNRELDSWKRD